MQEILSFPGADSGGAQPWVLPDEPPKNFVTFRYYTLVHFVAAPLLAVENC